MQKTTSIRSKFKRVISAMLAVLMIIMSIPFSSLSADAFFGFGGFGGFGGWGNAALVTTNYKVEFKDSSFNAISEAESGEMFYLMISISGNNVWQIPGQKNTYRVEITDNNLLLPNFAGNGFTDGATYSGYTMHVRANGTRYIEFSIKNGSTKVIRLQAKFANGTTPDNETTTIKLVNKTTNKSTSGSIKTESAVNWSSSKSEDKTQVSGSDISGNGVTVNYTLNAVPNNPADTTGAWWVTGLQFTDTITLPAGLTFTNGAITAITTAINSAVANAGYTIAKDNDGNSTLRVTASGDTAKIIFKIDSKNVKAGTTPPQGLRMKTRGVVKIKRMC